VAMIGCAVAATAKNINTLIGASTLIGVGSAMHQLAWSCLAELVPKKSRGLALGIFTASLAPASAFAPVIGNAFVSSSSWRFAYWLPFALDGAALLLVFLFYRPINQYIRHEDETIMQQIAALDWVGLFLLISGLVLFLLGISFGGHKVSPSITSSRPLGYCLFYFPSIHGYQQELSLQSLLVSHFLWSWACTRLAPNYRILYSHPKSSPTSEDSPLFSLASSSWECCTIPTRFFGEQRHTS
jgi:MFS family permease